MCECVFVKEAASHGDTLQLNEYACLQWFLGTPCLETGGGGADSKWLGVGWEPLTSRPAAEGPSVGIDSEWLPLYNGFGETLADHSAPAAEHRLQNKNPVSVIFISLDGFKFSPSSFLRDVFQESK